MGGAGPAVSAIGLDHRPQHREALQGEFPKKRDSVQRWELLKSRMERTRVRDRGAAPGGGARHRCLPRSPLTCLSP